MDVQDWQLHTILPITSQGSCMMVIHLKKDEKTSVTATSQLIHEVLVVRAIIEIYQH